MAYYTSSYPGSDFGEYNYNYNYYAANYGYGGYDYDQSSYYYPTYPALSYPTIAYSATTFSEPKFIEYDPNSEKSHLVIYYSTLEFNEPEFDEYDSTPYGGGYDLAQTYGKPLPPSNETCYPRSGSDSKAHPPGSIVPLPTVEEGTHEIEKAIIPQIGSAGQVTDEMPQSQISLTDLPGEEEDGIHDSQDLDPCEGEEDIEEHDDDDDDDDYYSGSGGTGCGFGNGYNGGSYYDGYEKQVAPQYPSGYGLEAMDLCESLFGYWPCLSRMRKNRENCCEEVGDDVGGSHCCNDNMWKGTADYLFGSPYPYGGGGRGEEGSSYGGDQVVYAYQRHCPRQSQYKQVEYNGKSWG